IYRLNTYHPWFPWIPETYPIEQWAGPMASPYVEPLAFPRSANSEAMRYGGSVWFETNVTDGRAMLGSESAGQHSAAYFALVQYPGCRTSTPYPPSAQRG